MNSGFVQLCKTCIYFLKDFLMVHIKKSFLLNLIQYCFCFMFWFCFWLPGMWDCISLLLWLLSSQLVVPNCLWPHRLQHVKLLCLPLSPRVCSNSCPLSQWYYLIISSYDTPFSFCLWSFPASGSFPMSWVFSDESALCIRWPKYWSFSFNVTYQIY